MVVLLTVPRVCVYYIIEWFCFGRATEIQDTGSGLEPKWEADLYRLPTRGMRHLRARPKSYARGVVRGVVP